MIIIDKLCYLSKLRYINPAEKFAFTVATLILCIAGKSIGLAIFIMAVNSWLTIAKGGISAKRFGKLMLVPLAFLLLSTLAILVNLSKSPLDAFAIPVGEWYITGSWAGIHHGLQLVATAMGSVSCLYFLALNTTMTDILALFRRMHIPALFVELMLLIYRFIFVLLDVAYYITTSQNARLGYKDFRTSLKSFAKMGQALFIRAMKRSGNLYDAMESRCYDGEIRVLNCSRPVSRKNMAIIAVFEIFLLGVVILLRVI